MAKLPYVFPHQFAAIGQVLQIDIGRTVAGKVGALRINTEREFVSGSGQTQVDFCLGPDTGE